MVSRPTAKNLELQRRSFVLQDYGLLAFVAIVLGGIWTSPFQDLEVMIYAVVITTLASLPLWLWLRSDSRVLPAFEILMLTGVQFYGYPLFSGHGAVATFSVDEIRPAAFAMIVYQVAAILTYRITPAVARAPRILRQQLIDDSSSKFITLGLTTATVFTYLFRYTNFIPFEYGSILRSLFFGINTVSVFVAMRRWGSGHLPREQRVWVVVNLIIQCLLNLRSLYLIEALTLNATAAMAYVSTSRRLPIGPIVAIAPLFFFLHAGKPAMRAMYWEGENAYEQNLTDLPRFFSQWVDQSLEALQRKSETLNEGTTSLIDRASLFQMLCIVTNITPTFVPYLEGESYSSMVDQLVPRILRPEKTSSVASNQLLALKYNLVNEESVQRVSIAFGEIAEAYANYSYYGCAFLGLFWGFLYKKAATAAVDCPSFSGVGIIMILLSAWALQAEMVMALWIVSLLQAMSCVVGLPLLWYWFNQRSTSAAA